MLINDNMFESIVIPDAFAETIASNLREAIVAIVLNNTANTRILTQKELEVLMELAENFSRTEELYFKTKGITNTSKFSFSKKNKTDELIQLFITLVRTNVWFENPINEIGKIGFGWHDYRTDKECSLYFITKTEEDK